MRLTSILLMVSLLTAPLGVRADEKCPGPLARLAGHATVTAIYPSWLLIEVMDKRKALMNPLTRPAAWKEIQAALKGTKYHALGFAAIWVLAKLGAVSMDHFDDATQDMDEPRDDDVIVAVNGGTTEGDKGWFAAEFRRKYGKNPKVIYVNATTPDEFMAALEKVAKEHGPITKLDVAVHGAPGKLQFGKENWTPRTHLPRTDIFAADAKIRLRSCYVGAGPEGQDFMQEFGKRFLPKGGEVAANTQMLTSRPSSFMKGQYGIDLGMSGRVVDPILNNGLLPLRWAATPVLVNVVGGPDFQSAPVFTTEKMVRYKAPVQPQIP